MTALDTLHTISLFVANKPGVLLRITVVFARRGFNIESLVVSSAFDGRFSRMTITAKGEDRSLEQIVKQLSKLVDVIDARDSTDAHALARELALIKINISTKKRPELLQIVEHFKAKTIDLTDESMIIEVSGNSEKISAMIALMDPFEVVELIRSGKIVMQRGIETGDDHGR